MPSEEEEQETTEGEAFKKKGMGRGNGEVWQKIILKNFSVESMFYPSRIAC